jgi:hypothetical protein
MNSLFKIRKIHSTLKSNIDSFLGFNNEEN